MKEHISREALVIIAALQGTILHHVLYAITSFAFSWVGLFILYVFPLHWAGMTGVILWLVIAIIFAHRATSKLNKSIRICIDNLKQEDTPS